MNSDGKVKRGGGMVINYRKKDPSYLNLESFDSSFLVVVIRKSAPSLQLSQKA